MLPEVRQGKEGEAMKIISPEKAIVFGLLFIAASWILALLVKPYVFMLAWMLSSTYGGILLGGGCGRRFKENDFE